MATFWVKMSAPLCIGALALTGCASEPDYKALVDSHLAGLCADAGGRYVDEKCTGGVQDADRETLVFAAMLGPVANGYKCSDGTDVEKPSDKCVVEALGLSDGS